MVGFIANDREIEELLPSEVWDSVFLMLPLQEETHPKGAIVSYRGLVMHGGKGLTLLTHEALQR